MSAGNESISSRSSRHSHDDYAVTDASDAPAVFAEPLINSPESIIAMPPVYRSLSLSLSDLDLGPSFHDSVREQPEEPEAYSEEVVYRSLDVSLFAPPQQRSSAPLPPEASYSAADEQWLAEANPPLLMRQRGFGRP